MLYKIYSSIQNTRLTIQENILSQWQKKYKVDEYAIKYIVGHTIKDLTERVYTKRDDDWLLEEIKKIK